MAKPEIPVPDSVPTVATEDGSSTCWNERVGEHYHSLHGAQTESEHVFIQAGLAEVAKRFSGSLRVLEVGFGTGLNALLADRWAEQHARSLSYLGFEPYPLPSQTVAALGFPNLPDTSMERLTWLHAGLAASSPEHLNYRKLPGSHPARCFAVLPIAVEKWVDDGERFHVVFHDAFSPDRDPAPWTFSILERLFQLMHPGAALVTYCAKGIIRRRLRDIGFQVERLPGPPGKREMLRAWRQGTQASPAEQ